ncbi:MAG: hypothetical protein HS116_17690 [Planctomycetes bacterium]|nr:hypothetical protein [Planctomycetota bacterium]
MPRKKIYPGPWVNVPRCGSYREFTARTFQLSYRPHRGASKCTRNVNWTRHEVVSFLNNLGASRQRTLHGLPVSFTWQEGKAVYRRRLIQKGCSDQYVKQVLALLEAFQLHSSVEITAVQSHHFQAWLDTLDGSDRTVKKMAAMISACFRKLRRLNFLAHNPAEAII